MADIKDQIGDIGGNEAELEKTKNLLDEAAAAEEQIDRGKTGMLGTKIATPEQRRKNMYAKVDTDKVTKIGENILENAEIRDGWIPVDRAYLGERDIFYPEDWEFLIRPATVEAIKNWSNIDEENPRSIDTVFNEVLKSCLTIRTKSGMPIVWSQINSWDRFFFILLIREYTFVKGEAKIEIEDECDACDNPVKFPMSVVSLMYDLPDNSVMHNWNREDRKWYIDTNEYGLDKGVLELYVPTVEKDMNIMNYITDLYQQKNKLPSVMDTLIKYLPWFIDRAPKDLTLLKRKVKQVEDYYNSWDTNSFLFIDEVIRNIQVTPLTKLKAICEHCGAECVTDIRFPDEHGISSLFAVQGEYKKFGTK